MKYLLVFVVLVVAWAVWRSGRADRGGDGGENQGAQRGDRAGRPQVAPDKTAGDAAQPVRMLACLHCGTHVPHTEAVQGERGAYCGKPHLLASEPGSRA